jgi:hypothetical protein
LMVWCSLKRGFELQDLWRALYLRNFEERGVLITERPTKRLSVGHRREKLFDRYFFRTILLVRSGCREQLPQWAVRA